MDKIIPDDVRFCQICTHPSLNWIVEPVAGQDFELKEMIVCVDCKSDFEQWTFTAEDHEQKNKQGRFNKRFARFRKKHLG